MRELKALLAGLAPKIDGLADGRLKALVQDLSRFAREARENYASAIGKSAFRERIEEAADRALIVWRDAVERCEAARQPLEGLAKVSRFGEVQVEKTVALCAACTSRSGFRNRGAHPGGRHTLRLAVGDSVDVERRSIRWRRPPRRAGQHRAGPRPFRPLVDCEKAARGDPTSARGSSRPTRAPCAS